MVTIMKRLKTILLTAAIAASVIPNVYADSGVLKLYVSPNGNDVFSGAAGAPYKTIKRAVRAVEALNKSGKISDYSKIEINLDGGTYNVGDGITFYSDNGGNENTKITFRADDGESVRINSASAVKGTGNVTDTRINESVRDKIKCADVSELNLNSTEEEYALNVKKRNPGFLVYQGNEMFTSARYPNKADGKNTFINISGKSNTTENGVQSFYIKYTDEDEARIENWSNTESIYIAGFPNVEWEYSKKRILGIDKDNNKISGSDVVNSYSDLKSAKFWFSNIIEELDAPGEYYYDSEKKKLYYYPIDDSDLYIASSDDPLFKLINTKNISFEGITFEGTVANAIKIIGGSDIGINGCTFKNIADEAVYMSDNTNSSVKRSAFYSLGSGGIYIVSDRFSLKEQNNLIEDCNFHDFENIRQVYSAAVRTSGVKNTIKNCNFENTYHTAAIIMGNDNVLESCKFQNICKGTTDAGAVYAYGDSTSRGNVIKNNYFSNIGDRVPSADSGRSTYGVWTVYLDGYTSGYEVSGNVFDTIYGGVFVNNGGYNKVDSNIFNNVTLPVLSYGVLEEDETFNKPAYADAFRNNRYNKFYNSTVWNTKYPELAQLKKEVVYPAEYYVNNTITNNKYYGPLCLYTKASQNAFTHSDSTSVISLRGGTVHDKNVKIPEEYSVSSDGFGIRN